MNLNEWKNVKNEFMEITERKKKTKKWTNEAKDAQRLSTQSWTGLPCLQLKINDW